jgi:O-antigen/teichoic acid export membrane protein
VSSIVIGVIPQVVAFSMAIYAGKGDLLDGHKFGWMMGNYYVAGYFAVLLSFISFPVATALFPVFSKIDPEKEPGLIKTVFASSVKYTALLLVPATMLLVALSTPLINTLFPLDGLFRSLFVVDAAPKYPYGPLFLALSCSVNLLVLVGNISVGTFQTGIKKTRQVMWQSVASLVIGLPLAYLIIMYFFQIGGAQYAVIGGIIGSLVATLPQVVWALHWSWKNYDAKADFGSSAKIFAASLLAAAVTYVFVSLLKLPYLFTLILGFAAFALIFLVSAPLIGAVNRSDLDNIQKMLSSLGVISAILKVPLGFMRRLCRSNNDAGGEKRQPMQS